MMSAVFLEPRWEPCIEKLFALIRLHAEWLPWRGLSANPFEPWYHFLRAFGFDRNRPGIFGQGIDHGQQIFVALIPFFACPPNPSAIVRLGQIPGWVW